MRFDAENRTYWYQWWKDRIIQDRQASVFLVDTLNHWEEIFPEETIEERAQLHRPSEPEWSPLDWAGEFTVEDTTNPQEIREVQNRIEEQILTAFYERAMVSLCVMTGMASDEIGAPWRERDFTETCSLEQLMSLVKGDDSDRAAHWMLNNGPVATETILVWFMMWWLGRPLPQGLVEMPPPQWNSFNLTLRNPDPIPFWIGQARPFSQWVDQLILSLAQRKGVSEEDIRQMKVDRTN